MGAGKLNLLIEQGATYAQDFRYKDSAGNPVDLTGYAGRMQIRPNKESTTVYLALSSSLNPDGTGIYFTGANNIYPSSSGTIGIFISSCTSSLLNFTEAYYDLEIYTNTDNCPYVIRFIEGQVRLNKEVTRNG
jgi:hypothetical protein